MEKFNLEEYLKNPSRKVVTRDGRKVRIICTDMNYKNHPIRTAMGDTIAEKKIEDFITSLPENGKVSKEVISEFVLR